VNFALSSSERGGGIVAVEVAGEVDIYTAPQLRQTLQVAIAGGTHALLVDLARATFMDSTALGVLLGALKRLRPEGGELAIACSEPSLRKIFEVTNLDSVFAIFDSAEAALAYLRELSHGHGAPREDGSSPPGA
jgi:anti-sigma B factor antagonist